MLIVYLHMDIEKDITGKNGFPIIPWNSAVAILYLS